MQQVIQWFKDLLTATAWEMETPKAYGLLHVSFMLIGFALAGLCAWKLRRASDRTNRAILLSIGIFLVLCEAYKLLMNEWIISPEDGFNWGNFPFQLCSIPMYLCLIIPCLKSQRLKRALYGFLMTFNLLGGFIAFFEPSGLLHGHWTLTFHALVWHMLLVFLGVYVGLSGRGCTERRHYKDTAVVFLVLCATAFAINCAFWEVSEHQIKMFFIGPGNSPIIVFKQISEMFGWVVNTAIYIPVVCLGAYLIFLPFCHYHKKCREKETTKAEEPVGV